MSLPKWCSDTLRTRKHDTRIIVWSIGMGFFAGVGGTYLFEHGLPLTVVALLGAAGILAGAAICGFRNLSRLHPARRRRTHDNLPQVRSQWDYRPRDVIHRETPYERGVESLDAAGQIGSATSSEPPNVWFDFGFTDASAEGVPVNSLPPKPYD